MFNTDKRTPLNWTKDKITLDPAIFTEPAPPPVPTLNDAVKFGAIDVYRAQMKAYEAQLKAHTAMFRAKQQETNPMPNNKVLFSVHIATNGYYAVSDSGITVVSTTLSEVCTAMQAALADEAARSDTDAVVKAMSDWQKVS